MYIIKGLLVAVVISWILTLGCSVKGYDCRDLISVPEKEWRQALEWCMVDPSRDFTKNEYHQTRDWKDGQWK